MQETHPHPMIVYQTADEKIWIGELIGKFDDGSFLVLVKVNGDNQFESSARYELVTPA
jgi:hypothetical protein